MVRTESQMVYSAKTRARRKNITLTIEAKAIFIAEASPICTTCPLYTLDDADDLTLLALSLPPPPIITIYINGR